MTDETVTAQRIRMRLAEDRACAAAMEWKNCTLSEVNAFRAGALWAAEQFQLAFTLTPKMNYSDLVDAVQEQLNPPDSQRTDSNG